MNNTSTPSVCAILLAGGIGTRMQSNQPKQFLAVGDKPLARHSFDILLETPEINEIIVVCAPEWRALFQVPSPKKTILFALPGERRQDSTYNGLQIASKTHDFICVHDAARPFIDANLIKKTLEAAKQHGAATSGLPIKFTLKESNADHFVQNTPDRSCLWEIHSPQIILHTLLIEGFQYANTHNITVTDDVSLIELLGKKVKLVEGLPSNLKVTVPSDLTFANYLHAHLNTVSSHVS